MRPYFTAIGFLLLVSSVAAAQEPGGGVLQVSNILNPNVSAIGWFQAEAGHRQPGPGDADDDGASLQMKEVELGFQSIVDSWARADIFVSVEPEEVSLEEGTLTWYRLPLELAVKVGKIKANLGRFNRLHAPETPFADRPLVQQNFLGAEGLSGAGASLSWHVPNPWLFVNLDAEAIAAPEEGESPAFSRTAQKDNIYIGRLTAYGDIGESWSATAGASAAVGNAGTEFDPVNNSSATLNSTLAVAEFTVRWKNPRRAIYRSLLWSTEFVLSRRDTSAASIVDSRGVFSYIDYRFARRWNAGARYDLSEFPGDGDHHESGRLLFLTYSPSEFSQVSLQGRQIQRMDGTLERLAFLKTTFNIGPHGAHPFQ